MADELQRFRSAVDLSGDSLYITAVETMRFIDRKAKACRRLGFSRNGMLTKGPMGASNKSRVEVQTLSTA